MDSPVTIGLGLVLLAIGAYLARDAWSYVSQYRTLSGVDHSRGIPMTDATGTAVGTARVHTPAKADGPGELDDPDNVGLLAWRIRERRRKRTQRGRRYSWSTEDAGLAVGEMEIVSGDDHVRVDTAAIEGVQPDGYGVDDPWDSEALHLGEADEIIRLDGGDVGDDLPISIDVGPFSTGNRTQLEINAVRDGDELLVHGRVEGDAITDPSGDTFIVGSGSVGDVVAELRKKIAKSGLIALALVIAGIALLTGIADGITAR